MKIAGFEWDDGNRGHCRKHGVTLAEIEEVFSGTVYIAPDLKHSIEEDRLLAIGRTFRGRYVFVVFLFRAKQKQRFIRPISARYMHVREIEKYEEKEGS